jgi:glutathione S-transferase
MTLNLYNTPHSTCSQKVRLCLAEKGLTWTDVHVDLATNEHLSPDYLEINPNGVVPTLVHDSRRVHDSSVISGYLDEVFPAIRLSPNAPLARAG